MPDDIQTKIAEAGELLIRAAAVIGTLSREQQERLDVLTEGKVTHCLAWALEGAASVSQEVKQSLQSHGPKGFIAMEKGLGRPKKQGVVLRDDFKDAVSQVLRPRAGG